MKPVPPDTMDAVFTALANERRRVMLDIIRQHGGCSVNDVAAYFDTSRIAVMKHLKVLESARLITSDKPGRTRRLYFNAVPIQMIYDRWTTEYSVLWASKLTRLKYAVESDLPEGPVPRKTRIRKKRKTNKKRKSHD